MSEFLTNLLTAVITAAIPVVSAFLITLINRARDKATAQTDDIKQQGYIKEIADAISAAVAATSQTYVDALKKNGAFTVEAQKEAANKALTACLASISPAAQAFIEAAYGDIKDYLTTKIEAEVRKQKNEAPIEIGLPAVLESANADTTAIAASTAAATAATIAQTAIQQISAEPTVPEQKE